MNVQPFLELPLSLDIKSLLGDLSICKSYSFVPHINTFDYAGSWDSIALRSHDGQATNIYAKEGNKEDYMDTELLQQCKYFQKLLSGFNCELESVRLLNLAAGSVIKPHRDFGLAYRFGCFRLHIPLVTNPEVIFHFGEEAITMATGSCWYADFDGVHSVENRGNTDRIHLVIDGKRNDWTDSLFKEAGYDFDQDQLEYDISTKRRMLEELKLRDDPVSQEISEAIKRELGL